MTARNRTRRMSRAATSLALAGVVTTCSLEQAAPASAWAWDPHVILNGKVECNYSTSNTPRWLWISSADGESGWASLSGSGMNRQYVYNFYQAPTSTMTVTATWGCSIDGQHKASFGVNRPASGNYATRNLCYWWGCF